MINLKKIITAINNPKLNEELKKENNFEIVGKDIQYKEAILEILEKINNIDLIIINEKIPGEITIEKLIKKIKLINEKIKIIFILENKNEELEKILIKNNINEIYYNNKINLNDLIKIINKKEINMEEEIIKLKKIIEEKNNMEKNILMKNNNLERKDKKLILEDKHLNERKSNFTQSKKGNININMETKIITFSGNYKSGKTTLSLVFSNYLKNENKKILLIDMDLEKQDLITILKKDKYLEKIKKQITFGKKNFEKNKKANEEIFNKYFKNKNIKKEYLKNKIKNNKKNKLKIKLQKNKMKKLINKKNNINYYYIKKIIKLFTIKINKNFYFFAGINFLLKNKKYKKEKHTRIFISNFLKILNQKNYDFIIIDLAKSNPEIINKEILKNSDIKFVLFEPNLLGIKELQKLLNTYKKVWKTPCKSLHIIANRKRFNSIDKNLISNLITKSNKIFEIKENKIYNILINSYFRNYYLLNNKNIKKEIYKIIKKLE